ncbi:hypothetical protein PGB90_002387 [Kerria lacca]
MMTSKYHHTCHMCPYQRITMKIFIASLFICCIVIILAQSDNPYDDVFGSSQMPYYGVLPYLDVDLYSSIWLLSNILHLPLKTDLTERPFLQRSIDGEIPRTPVKIR